MVKRAGDGQLAAMASQLGPHARPEPGWVAHAAGVTRSEAERAIAGVTAHASLVDQMSRTMAQTGRTYYAQFPAPIELYALVRLAGPHCLVETGVSAGVSSTFMLLGAMANKRGVLHSIDQPAPRAEDGGGPAWILPSWPEVRLGDTGTAQAPVAPSSGPKRSRAQGAFGPGGAGGVLLP